MLVSCPDGAHGPKRAARWSPGTFRPLPHPGPVEGGRPDLAPHLSGSLAAAQHLSEAFRAPPRPALSLPTPSSHSLQARPRGPGAFL